MQIKKKILMMSLAASMVIPNTLAFSMAYPIYAEEMMETNAIPSDAIAVTQQDFTNKNSTIFESTTTNTYTFKRGKNFKLTGDIDLSNTSDGYTINLTSSTKLYLNDKKITIGGSGNAAFAISGQGAEINGPGTIIHDRGNDSSKYINIYGFYLANNASFKMNEVTLDPNENATLFYFGPGSQVDVNNSEIKNGETAFLFGTNKVGSTLNLKNTTVKSRYGIRSHFMDTIQVENCIFNYEYTGIVSQGTTTVLNSKFTCVLSKDFYPQNYYFPPTRGIDIVRSELTSPLNVTIDGVDISKGDAGIVIADLCNTFSQNSSQVLNVNISNSTLEGEICGLGYTDKTLPFTLKNVKIADTEATPKKLKSTTLGVYGVELDPNFDGSGSVPYTIVSESDSSASFSLAKDDSLEIATQDDNSGILTSNGQNTVKETLKKEVKEKEKNDTSNKEIQLYKQGELSSNTTSPKLNYTYNVSEVNPIFSIETGDDSSQMYTFKVRLTAQLNFSSIICLLIPIQEKVQSSEVDEEIETMVLLETENSDRDTKTNPYPVYVELSEVLKNKDNLKSGLDSSKIEGILKNLKEENDLAQIEFDTSDLKKFENFNLDEAFVIKDIGEIIEFEASQAPTPTPTYRPSGGSKPKPKPEEPAQEEPMAPVATPTTMYRLYNRLTGEHLYTTDKAERDSLLTSDTWQNENRGWIAPSISDYPVYRLLNPNTGDHHYTTDKNEFDTLPVHGWIAEGIAFYSADKDNEENVILHRLYNPNAQGAGSHHYTTDENERDTLVAQGWKYEGTAWAGLKSE